MPEEDGKVQVVIKDETIWCTQKTMAQLFGVGIPAVSKHLKNIFDDGELTREVVVSKMEITTRHGAMEGKTQTSSADFYHLDAIIAVGYRVNSTRATRFRQWATRILNEYIRKGFVLDDDRLKQDAIKYYPTKEASPPPKPRQKPKANMTSSTEHSASTPTSTRR